jgi:Tol biopolymer transport system component/DNA-binding winged helix-turn-helix (wHTH) protein
MAITEAPERRPTIRFDGFELDRARQILSRDGVRLKLQKQPLQVLELLISHAPEVVSADQIRRHVWGDDVYIDAAQSIRFCIRQIRSILNDTSAAPRFVETLPKQGYRFIASLEGVAPKVAAAERVSVTDPSARPKRRLWLIFGLAGLAMLLTLVGVWNWYLPRNAISAVARISAITSYPGNESSPSLSPDGRQVAFAWDGESEGTYHIYVAPLGGQHAVRLTQDSAEEDFPAWSPNGKYIAFIRRHAGKEAEIVLIPSMGGPERSLQSIRLGMMLNSRGMLAWTPDSKWLCFTSEANLSGYHFLSLLSLESGRVRRLFRGQDIDSGEGSPSFSPDGHWLAFNRIVSPDVSRFFLQRLSSSLEPEGAPLEIKDAGSEPQATVWMPDSKSLLFLDDSKIMQEGIDTPARTLHVGTNHLEGLTKAAQAFRFVAGRGNHHRDIWTFPLSGRGLTAAAKAESIVRSTAEEGMPSYSPDGHWLAFSSWRSGASEIWLANSDGQNPRQLTHLGAFIAAWPHWSPDSKFLAFHARVPKKGQIYVTRIEDGATRQITHEQADQVGPSWSDDGKTLYVGQVDHGVMHVYNLPVAGGAPRRLWDGLGSLPVEAPGQKLLLYSKNDIPGIYARSLEGDPAKNPELRLVNDYLPPTGGISPVSDGFYYTSFTPSGWPHAIRFYSFIKHAAVDVAPAPSDLGLGLSVMPDRTRLAYAAKADGNEDLVEIEFK